MQGTAVKAERWRELTGALSGALGRLRHGVDGRGLGRALDADRTDEDGSPRRVLALDARLARALRQAGVSVLRPEETAVPHAACAWLGPQDGDPVDALRALAARVRPGGIVALCTPPRAVPRTRLSAAGLHAGLRDLTQQRAGRVLITAGRVPQGLAPGPRPRLGPDPGPDPVDAQPASSSSPGRAAGDAPSPPSSSSAEPCAGTE